MVHLQGPVMGTLGLAALNVPCIETGMILKY